MASHTLAGRAACFPKRRFFFVTPAAQVVELLLKQWPHARVGNVASHAKTAAGIVRVVVMAGDAVHRNMVEMRKRHRENGFRAFVVVRLDRQTASQRRTEDRDENAGSEQQDKEEFQSGRFRVLTNIAAATELKIT